MNSFKQHIKNEQPPKCFLQKGCSEKLHAWQSHVLVRKFQVVDLLRKYCHNRFPNNCFVVQNSPH